MRIWLVSRDGNPRAAFSTAADASDYVADNGGAVRCDVRCLVLDACTRTEQFFAMPRASNTTLVAAPGR
jgi:hypothetical protein